MLLLLLTKMCFKNNINMHIVLNRFPVNFLFALEGYLVQATGAMLSNQKAKLIIISTFEFFQLVARAHFGNVSELKITIVVFSHIYASGVRNLIRH